MNLKTYLNKNKIPHSEFARSIEVSYQTIYRIIEQLNQPTLDTAIKIVEATNGKVTFKDLVISKPTTKSKKT